MNRIISVILMIIMVFCLSACKAKKGENKYYFFDESIIKETHEAKLILGTVEKIKTNASWVDQYGWTTESGIPDWEQHVSILYPNVEYDEETHKYKMWYEALLMDSPIDSYSWVNNLIDKNNSNNVEIGNFKNSAKGVIYEGKDLLCYMESEDGINWVRPKLGEFFYKSRTGEIIDTNISYIGLHGLGVKRNENPEKNEPKYLMAGRAWETDSTENGEPVGVAISWSEDGIHWEEAVTIKTAFDCNPEMYYVRADTHNQLLWSPELGKYIVITRGYTEKLPRLRVVAYMESTDELKSLRALSDEKQNGGKRYWKKTAKYWTRPEIILDHNVSAGAQPYSMPIAHLAHDYYIGVVSVADFMNDNVGIWNSVHAELAWSKDAKNWNYIEKGTSFIQNAPQFLLEPGNDYGMIYCAAPINVNGNTEIFYAAVPELHYVKYGEIPDYIKEIVAKKIPYADDKKDITRTTTLNIARIDEECFAGYSADNGSITTALFEVMGPELKLKANTNTGGEVKVEIINKDGKVFSGYEEDVCNVHEKEGEKYICWSGKDLSGLKGKKVSFRIYLRDASVYSIGGNIKTTN